MENIEFEKIVNGANKDTLAGNIDHCIDMLKTLNFLNIQHFICDEGKAKLLGNLVFFGCNEQSLFVFNDEISVKKFVFDVLQSIVGKCLDEIIEEKNINK
jgi:hypothetical protein